MKKFIGGTLFAFVVLPVLECLLQIIQQLTNHFCTKIAARTYKISKDLPKEDGEDCGEKSFAIGFQLPSKEEEYYDEEEDE